MVYMCVRNGERVDRLASYGVPTSSTDGPSAAAPLWRESSSSLCACVSCVCIKSINKSK
jgi:hypothetical protein